MKYTILVIDEQETEVEQFENFFELANDFNVVGLTQIDDVEMLYNFIRENGIDAVAFDYRLMEYNSTFNMNGDSYLKLLLEQYQDFPAIIITNKVQDAKVHSIDPFRVIDKEIININPENEEEKQKGIILIDNIRYMIENYKEEIQIRELELRSILLESSQRSLSIAERQRIVELDDFLENTFSKSDRIPKEFKDNTTLQTLSTLVAKTDQLLKRMEK